MQAARTMINGTTELIAHIGFPTHTFKSPLIYNPYFQHAGLNVVVVPMACRAEHFEPVLRAFFALNNARGALITMPHKVKAVDLLDEVSERVQMAGSCNAIRRSKGGLLQGDMFDGEGFVRALKTKGFDPQGKAVLLVGTGGVGSAIAASLVQARVARIDLVDPRAEVGQALADRLLRHAPRLQVGLAPALPQAHHDLVINASPLGMQAGDALPLDVSRLHPRMWVAEVVMGQQPTPLLRAARAAGCQTLEGTDMLYEQIPVYLSYFDLPSTTAQVLRDLSAVGLDQECSHEPIPHAA
jgi:shikimate dehydrogenase